MNTTLVVPPPLPGYTTDEALFARLCHQMGNSITEPEVFASSLLDDVFEEITNPDIPRHMHHTRTGILRGCTGPLCSRWRADKTRMFKRFRFMTLGVPEYSSVGGRKPAEAARMRATTRIIVLYMLWSDRKVPISLIEACLIDGVAIPETPNFQYSRAHWADVNASKEPANQAS